MLIFFIFMDEKRRSSLYFSKQTSYITLWGVFLKIYWLELFNIKKRSTPGHIVLGTIVISWSIMKYAITLKKL